MGRASSGVYDSLQEFHAFFAASFGRKQWRDHRGNYLQALLVQDQERRNAENLSESVGISARAMQRFLTEARWSDETVIGRLQEYLAPRLGHPEAVWVFDGSDFPKQGRKSAGVARQYCGRLGKVANCQGGMFLAYVSPLGRALVDKRLYLPKSWTSDQDPVCGGGCAGGPAELPVKDGGWPWSCWSGSWELGHLRAEWVAGDDAFGMSPTFREGTGGPGDALRAGRSGRHYGPGPWSRLGPVRNIRGSAAPANPSCGLGSGGPWSSAVMNCRMRLGGR